MELQVRKLQESDWNLIPKWWEAYDEKILPRDMLPGSFKVGDKQEEKRKGLGGFMVCKGDDPIAAMWLWMTNSSMAIPAAIGSSPLQTIKPPRPCFFSSCSSPILKEPGNISRGKPSCL